MSADMYADVLAFHQRFGCAIGEYPQIPDTATEGLRLDLMTEELDEIRTAMESDDLVGVADGLADLIYVALGTAITYGIDLRPVWRLVHESNMAKVGGATRADGKILKPEGWTPPDVAGEIRRQRAVARNRTEERPEHGDDCPRCGDGPLIDLEDDFGNRIGVCCSGCDFDLYEVDEWPPRRATTEAR